jgi:hypothetical protein
MAMADSKNCLSLKMAMIFLWAQGQIQADLGVFGMSQGQGMYTYTFNGQCGSIKEWSWGVSAITVHWIHALPSRNFGILLKFMKWPLNPSWIPGNAWKCAGYFQMNFRRLPVWISDDCQPNPSWIPCQSAKPQLNFRPIDFTLTNLTFVNN